MTWIPYVTMSLLGMVGMLLIFIILLQRGRGGGLAGALGGAGGQSAFGTKAGDVFTTITVVLALIWVVLAAVNVWALGSSKPIFKPGEAASDAAAVKADDKAFTPPGAGDMTPADDGASGTAGDSLPAMNDVPKSESTPPSPADPATDDPAAPAKPEPEAKEDAAPAAAATP
ncbi:MAG: preprotein translocase subunit SecG, partial [Planctomycetaceae bacterium]|nr:preprotein translocase subunit SecG [Planctomycetaceae bacterium]